MAGGRCPRTAGTGSLPAQTHGSSWEWECAARVQTCLLVWAPVHMQLHVAATPGKLPLLHVPRCAHAVHTRVCWHTGMAPGFLGCLYHLSCPQVECNSKLDPTNTTFLKVGWWQGAAGRSLLPMKLPIAFCPRAAGCLHLPIPGPSWPLELGLSGESRVTPAVASCQRVLGDDGQYRHPPKLSRTFSLQMADSGGLPQVTQVSPFTQFLQLPGHTGP